ncbi:hypothetical protein ACFFX0_19155 [Citricoccus parietis]|uniref:Secreted protein n=1 Tax=Citricoccus parietis TaxID=592307 RepID=A0ABV5G2P1_9MICC
MKAIRSGFSSPAFSISSRTGESSKSERVLLVMLTVWRSVASVAAQATCSPSVDTAPVRMRRRASRSSSASRFANPPCWAELRASTPARTSATAVASSAVRASAAGRASICASTGSISRSMPKLSNRRGRPWSRMS